MVDGIRRGNRWSAALALLLGLGAATPALAGGAGPMTAEKEDPTEATDLRGLAKAMAYDLASFTWPGWDEPGISPSKADEAAGLDAARLNLRLAVELKRGPEPMMNAHWILGAQQFAHGQLTEAAASFETAAEFARKHQNRGGELMCQGYALLTRLLAGADPEAEKSLQVNAEALVKEKDGEFFRDQLATARRVFSARFKR